MNLVSALSSAISDKDLDALPALRASVQAELVLLEGRSSQNYANHLRSLLRELESVIPDVKLKVPATTSVSNYFRA